MPKASAHQSSTITKRLLIGDSGTGKTTALWSLVANGYKLRIYDWDNLLEPLIAKIKIECPDKLDNIEFMSFRDKIKSTEMGPVADGQPEAFVKGMKALDKWEDGTKPSEWGPEYVAVVDTLTTKSRAALWWAKGMQGAASMAEGVSMKGYSPEKAFHTAQQALMNSIALLTSPAFNANVLVLAHIRYIERDGVTKGFPVAVGTAIGPEIPTYFSSVTLATKSIGASPKRLLRTRSTNMIDLKDPRAFDPAFADEIPMDDLWRLF